MAEGRYVLLWQFITSTPSEAVFASAPGVAESKPAGQVRADFIFPGEGLHRPGPAPASRRFDPRLGVQHVAHPTQHGRQAPTELQFAENGAEASPLVVPAVRNNRERTKCETE